MTAKINNIALLIPVDRERGYGKKPFEWIPCYKVIAPNGNEIQPYMRKITNRFEQSAKDYCKAQGWETKILHIDEAHRIPRNPIS
jgi:hypothetical protein